MSEGNKAVVLLSGGLDSSTVLALARSMGYSTYCLTILYGQRHSREIESAKRISTALSAVEHRVVEIPIALFDSSSLTGMGEIPIDRQGRSHGIPSTYVPARNLVFLSMAFAWAESIGAKAVFIGVTAIDYSGYPDCRPEFIQSFQRTANMATKAGTEGQGITIEAPLMHLSKAEIVKLGRKLELDHSMTWSCYRGGKKACGRCDSCLFRLKGFKEAGIPDPLEYDG